jgi:AraC-like DNA-binding protein
MMTFDQIDLMGRGGSLALLFLWSWILIRDHRAELSARLAVLMSITIACYLLITAGWNSKPTVGGLLLALGSQASPGLFWLFAKAWFNDEKTVSRSGIFLVLLTVVNALVMQVIFIREQSFFSTGLIIDVSGVFFRIAMLSFATAAFWEIWRSREGDLVEERRKIRPRLVAAIGICVVVIAVAEVAAHSGLAERYGYAGHSLVRFVASPIIFITFAFCVAMLGMRQADLFGATHGKTKPAAGLGIDDPMAEKLLAHMTNEMPHRDERLSIAKLAAQLGEQEYRLRRTINRAMGHRNFASFLNGYRLAEVKSALADPTQREVPIITIALDAGFGSLGTFNRAFREAEGMTPSEYRARAAG